MRHYLLFIALLATSALFSQDIKTKKNIVSVDDVEWLSKDKGDLNIEKTKCVLSSVKTGKPIFSIYIVYYVSVGKPKMDINFIDFDGTCTLTSTVKDLYRSLYKMQVIDMDGKVDQEKAKAFIRLYNEKERH